MTSLPVISHVQTIVEKVAAAAAVVAQPGVEVDIEGEQEDAEAETESGETPWEERDVVDRVVSGGIYDKHTKLYEPVGGEFQQRSGSIRIGCLSW